MPSITTPGTTPVRLSCRASVAVLLLSIVPAMGCPTYTAEDIDEIGRGNCTDAEVRGYWRQNTFIPDWNHETMNFDRFCGVKLKQIGWATDPEEDGHYRQNGSEILINAGKYEDRIGTVDGDEMSLTWDDGSRSEELVFIREGSLEKGEVLFYSRADLANVVVGVGLEQGVVNEGQGPAPTSCDDVAEEDRVLVVDAGVQRMTMRLYAETDLFRADEVLVVSGGCTIIEVTP